jgi:hypothetical protein
MKIRTGRLVELDSFLLIKHPASNTTETKRVEMSKWYGPARMAKQLLLSVRFLDDFERVIARNVGALMLIEHPSSCRSDSQAVEIIRYRGRHLSGRCWASVLGFRTG